MIFLLLEIIGLCFAALGARGRSWLSWALAFLAFDILRSRRKLVMQNLARAFGPETSVAVRSRVGRASVANFILTTLEFFAARWIFKQQKIDFVHAERLHEALSQKQGVYLMSIHCGNFEMMAYGLSQEFAHVHAPVKPVGKGQMALWVKRKRFAHGITEIANDSAEKKSRTTRIIEGLKKNEIVGFMVDQRRAKGILVPFFGDLAWTNSGLFYLWKQNPAPVIPVTIKRVGLNHHEISIHEEFVVENDENWKFDEFILRNTKKMNQCVEALVASNPQEYFWMHDRWRK
jgi:KDO2-lipid IV(A) lauroyltransferase